MLFRITVLSRLQPVKFNTQMNKKLTCWIVLGLTAQCVWANPQYGDTPQRDFSVVTGVSTVLGPGGKPWFNYKKLRTERDGKIIYDVFFTSDQDGILSEESYTLSSSKALESYRWSQHQTHEEATVEVKQNELRLSYQKEGAKEPAVRVLKLNENQQHRLVIPAMVNDLLIANWDELEKKGEFEFWVLVPDRMDIFTFKASLETSDKQETVSEQVICKVKPKSFLVGLVSGTIQMVYGKDKKLTEVRGIEPPLRFKLESGALAKKQTAIRFQ